MYAHHHFRRGRAEGWEVMYNTNGNVVMCLPHHRNVTALASVLVFRLLKSLTVRELSSNYITSIHTFRIIYPHFPLASCYLSVYVSNFLSLYLSIV